MTKADEINVTGKVVKVLPGNKFTIQLDNMDRTILCHLLVGCVRIESK